MALKDILDATRAASRTRLGPERLAIMERTTEALRHPDIMGKVVGVGAAAPAFRLASFDGQVVDSQGLLARGPLVLSFFRGQW